MSRDDYAFPCAGCLCDHCANNLYSSDQMAGEAKIFCYVCEECRYYDGDLKNKDMRCKQCENYIVTNEHAERLRKKDKGGKEMRKIKEKRMQSYVLRARKMVQEGKNKEGAEMLSEGMSYYSKNIIKAITPYATADAGIISMILRNLADDIEKNNPGAKELRMWAENNTVKPELKETIKIKKPNLK